MKDIPENRFNLGILEFNITERNVSTSGDIVYTCIPNQRPLECPYCGSTHVDVHRLAQRKVRDLNERDMRVGLLIKGHRYRCRDCHQTIKMDYPSIDGSGKMTKRLREKVQEEAFFDTFKAVADRYDLSVPAVQKLFEEKASEFNATYKPFAPEVLGIDEVHLHSNYCGVYVDVLGQRVIEMTQKRNKNIVKSFLEGLDDKDKIVCVTMDMWNPYKDAVNDILPGIPVIVDKFHVIKELQKILDGIRVGITKELPDKKSRSSLRNNRFLLLASSENLSKMQHNRLNQLLDGFPEFKMPYLLKESFRMIYECETREEAERTFEEWKAEVVDNKDTCAQFLEMVATVENWRTEIFNYFDNRYTNAETESLNNTIRELDRAGRGYSFKALRAKTLFRRNFERPAHFSFDI